MTGQPKEHPTQQEIQQEFLERRRRIREKMGGVERIARQHARGRMTIRERIDTLVDPGSFCETGTFTASIRVQDRDLTPGDGKIGGWATIDGRPVVVSGDDGTVMHGSSSVSASRRSDRLWEHALAYGMPYVYFGETGGARLPDALGSEGHTNITPTVHAGQRARQFPMVTAICGESFGGSSFQAAYSDFVVQVRGTTMAVSSPRVIEVAIGEQVEFEELGGVDVHLEETGQIDCEAQSEEHACAILREFLSYLPSNAWELPPELPFEGPMVPDPGILDIVPTKRNRGYDGRKLLKRLVDGEKYLELKPRFGPSLVTALARIGGKSVGMLVSDPRFFAGALSPQSCDKATAFICLCDSFNIPLVFLMDTPGFIVGKKAEHDRLLAKAIMMMEAVSKTMVPRISVVIRKAFGLAYYAMSGNVSMGTDLALVWPGCELSFMDPDVGANVVYAKRIAGAPDPEEERKRRIEEFSTGQDPYGAAQVVNVDEIIDPAETRVVILNALRRMRVTPPPKGQPRPLAHWPTCL
ncbi:acyl-CoA carboxylase subunit beta [Thermodesulfobacteriota bacterium]